MIIHVQVKTSSGKQDITKEDNGNFIVHLKSAPEDNKANVELAKLLQRFFKKKVKIKSGFTSKNKIVEVLD